MCLGVEQLALSPNHDWNERFTKKLTKEAQVKISCIQCLIISCPFTQTLISLSVYNTALQCHALTMLLLQPLQPVLSVWDSCWPQPCQHVCGVSADTSGHHRRHCQTGTLVLLQILWTVGYAHLCTTLYTTSHHVTSSMAWHVAMALEIVSVVGNSMCLLQMTWLSHWNISVESDMYICILCSIYVFVCHAIVYCSKRTSSVGVMLYPSIYVHVCM